MPQRLTLRLPPTSAFQTRGRNRPGPATSSLCCKPRSLRTTPASFFCACTRVRVRSQRSLLLPFLADVRPSVDRTDSSTHDCAARARRPASRSRLPAAATLVSATNSYALKLDSPRLVWHPTAETPFSPCDGSCYNTPNHPNSSRGGPAPPVRCGEAKCE